MRAFAAYAESECGHAKIKRGSRRSDRNAKSSKKSKGKDVAFSKGASVNLSLGDAREVRARTGSRRSD